MRKLFERIESIAQRWAGTTKHSAATPRKGHLRNRLQRFEQLEQRQLLSITTEGFEALYFDDVRERFGLLGDDVSIGVIADGLDGMAASQASDDLPGTITSSSTGSGSVGTAMLEVIYDIAPNASLYFAPADTASEFTDAVTYLSSTVDPDGEGPKVGVDVIVSAWSDYGQPWFQDGAAAAAVDAITPDKVFVNAAGQDGEIHYQAAYDNFGFFGTGGQFSTHDFGGGGANADLLVVDAGAGTVTAHFQWSEAWGSLDDDYHLYMYGWSGTEWVEIDQSADPLETPDDAYRIVSFNNSGSTYDQIAVQISDQQVGGSNDTLEIIFEGPVTPTDTADLNGGSNNYIADDAVFGPAAVSDVFTVGAVDVNDPDLDTVEADSSRGGSTIIGDGVRDSLDGVSVDHVSTTVLGANGFVGTAAAAAHTGAAAGLLVQALTDAGIPTSQIHSILRTTAIDIEAAGYDNDSGAGIFDALETAYFLYEPDPTDLDAASDTGQADDDNVTFDATPTFNGFVPANSYVELYANGNLVGSQELTGGNVAYSITADADLNDGEADLDPLPDGTYDFTIKVAGTPEHTLWNESDPLEVLIDTTAPTASIPDLADASDLGMSNSDNITSAATLDFTGTAADTGGSGVVSVVVSDGDSGSDTDGNYYQVSLASVAEGNHDIIATVTDLAGNVLVTDALAITVDRTAPTGSVPDLAAGSDTGQSDADDVTQGVDPQFVGTAEDTAGTTNTGVWKVEVVSDDAVSATDSADPFYDVTLGTLAEGGRTVAATVYDVAGNTFTTAGLSLTVDRTAPTASVPDLAAASDTGAADDDDITQGLDPQFLGTADGTGSDVWKVVVSSDDAKSAEDAASPFYDVTLATLDEGARTVTATVTDAAGNEFTTTGLALTVDRTAPINLDVDLDATSDSGLFDDDNITMESELLMTVTPSDPGSGIDTVDVNGQAATLNAGTYETTFTGVVEGIYTYQATVTDVAGNAATTDLVDALEVTVDQTAPTADVIDVTPDPRDTNLGDLDLQVDFDESVAGVDLADFSLALDGTPIAMSAGGGQSVTGGDQSYFLAGLGSLTGDNGSYQVTLTATGSDITDVAGNPLVADADDMWDRYSLVLYGTGAADEVTITTDGTTHTVVFNGDVYTTDGTIYVDGGGGDDMATIVDGTGDDAYSAASTGAMMDWGSDGNVEATVVGMEEIYAQAANGGDDEAMLSGSDNNDRFYGREAYSILLDAGGTYYSRMDGFETVTADLTGSAGSDRALLYDGDGDDILDASPTMATLDRPSANSTSVAIGFNNGVYAHALNGGTNDIANLTGSDGDDTFTSYADYSSLIGAGYYNRVEGFEVVTADLTGSAGDDRAVMYDSAGDDTLEAYPDTVTLDRPSVNSTATAIGFNDGVYASATNGGTNDTALLYGSDGNDYFYGRSGYGLLLDAAGTYYNRAIGFEVVTADLTGSAGSDRAVLSDSTGDDTLEAYPDMVTLDRPSADSTSIAIGFNDGVYASATDGGTNDTAIFYGSDNSDVFTSYAGFSSILDTTRSYYNRAEGFETVTADLTGSAGDDRAVLYDSAGDDDFEATPDTATLDRPSANSTAVAIGFSDGVYATATNGGANDTATFYGSDGDDIFYGRATYGLLLDMAGTYYNRAIGFEVVSADLTGSLGNDRAVLSDSAGVDELEAFPEMVTFDRPSVSSTSIAIGFNDGVYAVASSPDDSATFYGSENDDVFSAFPDFSSMVDTGGTYYTRATGFTMVTADLTGSAGNNVAIIHDSTGADLFTADPTEATMSFGSGVTAEVTAIEFQQVYAEFAEEGADEVELLGSDGANRFVGHDDLGYLSDTDVSFEIYLSYLAADDTVTVDSGEVAPNDDEADVVNELYDLILAGGWL